MMNGATFSIVFNVLFCYVGALIAAIDKNVVPGVIFRRLAFCYLFIPILTTKELWIYINNNTTVLEKSVVDELSDIKLCYLFVHYLSVPIKSWFFKQGLI